MASFSLPADLPLGNYSVAVKNNLPGASWVSAKGDAGQTSIAVVAPLGPTPGNHTYNVAAGDVTGLLAALVKAAGTCGGTVQLAAGTWNMARLDRITVPQGTLLRGAGMSKTALRWPTQTGAACVTTGWPAQRVALVSGGEVCEGEIARGWGLEDVTVEVVGGMEQNDTKAYCSVVSPCSKTGCISAGMRLRRINVSAVSLHGGVDMFSPGVGMGALVEVFGNDISISNSIFTHFGNCGSNVTPLIEVSGSKIVVRGNTFNFGCTYYSMRSVTGLLWRENTALHFQV